MGTRFSFAAVTAASVPSKNISEKTDDPFQGLDTEDINHYSELFDVPSPENDIQAEQLSCKIKKWIKDGRPNT